MTIGQFLYTHCQSERCLLDRPLGYGPTASSFTSERLKKVLNHVESMLDYSLPPDTPSDEILKLDASSAPRRLMHKTDLGGFSVATQVCYRRKDSVGRDDSFFSHVLVREKSEGDAAWKPLDVVSLWGATSAGGETPFWIGEETDFGEPVLPDWECPVDLDESVGTRCLDDRLLGEFLQSENEDGFHDPGELIPERWKRRPAAGRRQLLIRLVGGFIEAVDRGVSLLVVAEPSFSALLFYGVIRFFEFPSIVPDDVFSFSTFEWDPDDLKTNLAAIPTMPVAESESLETVSVGDVVVDTFAPADGSEVIEHPGTDQLVRFILAELDQGGWPRVNRALATINRASPATVAEAVVLAAAYGDASRLVTEPSGLVEAGERAWKESGAAQALFDQEVISRLLENEERPEEWYGTRWHAESIEVFGTRETKSLKPEEQQVVTELVKKLLRPDTDDLLLLLLRSPRMVNEFKAWLIRVILGLARLPKGSEFLWDVDAGELGPDHVLSHLLGRLMGSRFQTPLKKLCGSVPDDRLDVLLSAAAHGIRQREYSSQVKGTPGKWAIEGHKAMQVVLGHVSDKRLCEFVAGPFGESGLAVWPESGGELDVRLQQVARTLAEHPDEFSLRITGIRAANELGREKLTQIADWEALSAELWRLKQTKVTEIDYDEFVEFRATVTRLNVFRWHSPDRAGATTRMKRSIEVLQTIADVVASENEGVHDQVTTAPNIEPGLVLVGLNWGSGKISWEDFESCDFGERFRKWFPQAARQIRQGLETGDFTCHLRWDPRGWSRRTQLTSAAAVAALVCGLILGALL